MKVFIIILLVVLAIRILLTYRNFKHRMRFNHALVVYLGLLSKETGSNRDLMPLACALSLDQQYKEAYDLYQALLMDPQGLTKDDIETIKFNMKFCAKPLPGMTHRNISEGFCGEDAK